jgi:hypothetical protein
MMDKKIIYYLNLITFFLIISTSCSPKHMFPTVQSSWVLPYDMESYQYPQTYLSYTGNHLLSGDLRFLDTKTGDISRPLDSFLPQEWLDSHFSDNIHWSDTGNLLIVETHRTGGILPPEAHKISLIDKQKQTISEGLDIGPVFSSSPFGNHIVANPDDQFSWLPQLYDIENNKSLAFAQSPQNIKSLTTAGNDFFLWDKNSNSPVASQLLRHTNNDTGETIAQVGYLLLYPGNYGEIDEDFSTEVIVYESKPPDNIIDLIFDPSGEYLVLTKWECDPDDTQQCTTDPDVYYTDSIMDTVILLINWRTGEEHELFRLSDIVSDHLIGSYTTWSMDGSTLLLWRQDAPPVVLKIKYPR